MAILLVDDDPAILRLLRSLLDLYRAGEIIEADSGAAALEAMQRHAVTGMIVDLLMPGMDGTELVRQVRAADRNDPLPLMVMSAVADGERISELQAMNIADYLLKPINPVVAGPRIQAFVQLCRDHRRTRS